MSKPPFLYLLGGALALAGAVCLPRPSSAQAGPEADPLMATLLADISLQQTQLTENQAKIDEKLGVIAEDVRVSRIFAGRGGGKAK